MDAKWKKILEGIGLSPKESVVYLSALECGPSPASVIAERAKMNRVTTYTVLQKLLEKKLVIVTERAGIQNFSVISPIELQERAQQNLEDLVHITPQLSEMFGQREVRPAVRFLEGLEGVKKGYAETLKSKTEILSIANSQNIRSHWQNYDEEYVEKRAKKKIFLRGVAPADESGKIVHREDEQFFREIRLLSPQIFSVAEVENEICIFDNSVLIASFEPDLFAILIESPTVASTQRQIFEMLWRSGEHL